MLDKNFLIDLRKYVENHFNKSICNFCKILLYEEENACKEISNIELEKFIKGNQKLTFNQVLFGFIDKKSISDSCVYKKAGIDRRHFPKIRSNPEYRVSKNTTIALALALELNKKETDKLLSAASYSLSDSNTFDLIIQFCVKKKIYDIYSVNQALDYFSLKPLMGVQE